MLHTEADRGGEGGYPTVRGDVPGNPEADDGGGAGHGGAYCDADGHLRRTASAA